MRHALILAGGSGTRLWPLSRENFPKQILPVVQGQSLLRLAFDRLEGLIPREQRHVCASAAYERDIRAALPDLESYIAEPIGRDTLPAVALSLALIGQKDPEATVAVLTSDHLIEPADKFREILDTAYRAAEQNPRTVFVFGIKPSFAATGYGYVELDEGGPADSGALRVKSFREKPDPATAESFFRSGAQRYLWNSGMFVWSLPLFQELLARYEPEMSARIGELAAAGPGPFAQENAKDIYSKIKKISIDYGLMEPASRSGGAGIEAFPFDLSWTDIGSWNSFASLSFADKSGNVFIPAESSHTAASAALTLVDSERNLVVAKGRRHLVACLGCKDLVIVHTDDATLICPRDRAEELKKLYGAVLETYGHEFL